MLSTEDSTENHHAVCMILLKIVPQLYQILKNFGHGIATTSTMSTVATGRGSKGHEPLCYVLKLAYNCRSIMYM